MLIQEVNLGNFRYDQLLSVLKLARLGGRAHLTSRRGSVPSRLRQLEMMIQELAYLCSLNSRLVPTPKVKYMMIPLHISANLARGTKLMQWDVRYVIRTIEEDILHSLWRYARFHGYLKKIRNPSTPASVMVEDKNHIPSI